MKVELVFPLMVKERLGDFLELRVSRDRASLANKPQTHRWGEGGINLLLTLEMNDRGVKEQQGGGDNGKSDARD